MFAKSFSSRRFVSINFALHQRYLACQIYFFQLLFIFGFEDNLLVVIGSFDNYMKARLINKSIIRRNDKDTTILDLMCLY